MERHSGDVDHRRRSRGVPRSVLTFLFEGEILCQMSTFMVSPQKKECLWVEDFQRPKVQHTLKAERQVGDETASFSPSAFKPTENFAKCLHIVMQVFVWNLHFPFLVTPGFTKVHQVLRPTTYTWVKLAIPECLSVQVSARWLFGFSIRGG